jgi:hypothetical protein
MKLIPPTAPHSSSIIRNGCNKPNCGRLTNSTVSPHFKKLKKKVVVYGLLQFLQVYAALLPRSCYYLFLSNNFRFMVEIHPTLRRTALEWQMTSTIFLFCNPILFAICTSTFSKLCRDIYTCIQCHVEKCSAALLRN